MYPETIIFDADGKEHTAVVSDIGQRPSSDQMVREADGQRYTISIAFGEIPGYPGVGFIARPVIE